MKVRSKLTNRAISILCLSVFVLGIALVGVSTYVVYSLYKENQRLEEIKNNISGNVEAQLGFEELHFDDYYSVYVDDGYQLIDDTNEDSLISFTK